MYLAYTPQNISRSISNSYPIIFMIILSPYNEISVCMNESCVSNIITSIFCFESITPVVMIASDALVKLVTSSREMYAR